MYVAAWTTNVVNKSSIRVTPQIGRDIFTASSFGFDLTATESGDSYLQVCHKQLLLQIQ